MLKNIYCRNDFLFLKNLKKRLVVESRIDVENLDNIKERLFFLEKFGTVDYLKDLYKKSKNKKREEKEFLYCNFDLGIKYTGSARFELYPRYLFAIDQKYRYGYISGIIGSKECFELFFKIYFTYGFRAEKKYKLHFTRYSYRIYKYKYRKILFKTFNYSYLNIREMIVFSRKKILTFVYKKMGIQFFLKWNCSRSFYIKKLYRSSYDFDVCFFYQFIKMLEYRLQRNKLSAYFFVTDHVYIILNYLYQHISEKIYFFLLYLYKKSGIFTLYWSFVFIRFFALMKYLKYILILCKDDNILLLIKYNNMLLKQGVIQNTMNYLNVFEHKDNEIKVEYGLKQYLDLSFYKVLDYLQVNFCQVLLLKDSLFLLELFEIYEIIYECKELKYIKKDYIFFKKRDIRKQLFLLDGFLYGLKIKKEILVELKSLKKKNFYVKKSKKNRRYVTRKTLYYRFQSVIYFLRKWRKKIRIKKYIKSYKKLFYKKNNQYNLKKIQLSLRGNNILKYNNKFMYKYNDIRLFTYLGRYIFKYLHKKYKKVKKNKKIFFIKKKYNIIVKKKKLNYYNKRIVLNNLIRKNCLKLLQKKICNKHVNFLKFIIRKIIKKKLYRVKVIGLKRQKRYNNKNIIDYINSFYYKKKFVDFLKLKKKKKYKRRILSFREYLRKYLKKKIKRSLRIRIDKYLLKCIKRNKKKYVKKLYTFLLLNQKVLNMKFYLKMLKYNNINENNFYEHNNLKDYVEYNKIKIQNIIKQKRKNIFSYNILMIKKQRNLLKNIILRNAYNDFKLENEEYEHIEIEPLTEKEQLRENQKVFRDILFNKDEQEIYLNIQKRELLRKKLMEDKDKKVALKGSKFLRNYLENMVLDNDVLFEKKYKDFNKYAIAQQKISLYKYYLNRDKQKWNFFNYYWNSFKINSYNKGIKKKKLYLKQKRQLYIILNNKKKDSKKLCIYCKYNYFFRNNIINKQKVYFIGKKICKTKKYIYKKKKLIFIKKKKGILLVSNKFLNYKDATIR